MLLKKNNPAPYSGILAPTGYIKDLEQRADQADFYKQQLDMNTNCVPELPEVPDLKTTQFLEGIGVGVVATALVFIGFGLIKN